MRRVTLATAVWSHGIAHRRPCHLSPLSAPAEGFPAVLGLLRAIHDRMPVLLAREDIDAWLSGAAGAERLKPASPGMLRSWPVSKYVNRRGNDDDATLIEPLVA